MGAQIAALFSSVGVDVHLFDRTPGLAEKGLDRLRTLTPEPYFTPDAAGRIRTAGFGDSAAILRGCDWIIEAVIEEIGAKRALLARVDDERRPGSIVSTNTSCLPVNALADGRSDDFRRHFLGTHFFNPPRYLHLLELVPASGTEVATVDLVRRFADLRLGKGVVVAKDTPGFIGNHLGVFAVALILDALAGGRYSIEEIDAMTGPAIGRPKSATFRTLDLAGLDVFAQVARSLADRLPDPDARSAFELPSIVAELLTRGWVGEKAGQGFYKRVKRPDGESQILVLDPATFEYVPTRHVSLPALEDAGAAADSGKRLRMLFLGQDRVGAFLRNTLGPVLVHATRVTPAIADSIDDVDRVMRWGFGWNLGPFEILDAIGVRDVVTALSLTTPPPLLQQVLGRSRQRFREGALPPVGAGLEVIRSAREQSRVVQTADGASLVDLGDGVLAVEFHSKMNTIDADAIGMLHAGVQEAARNFRALVVGNEAVNFSAGANLARLVLAAGAGRFDEIDGMVRAFQSATLALKYADVPVVVAPRGLAIGGGCEIMLHADRVQAAVESYIGLVETSVGLIPGGGGTKEMLIRSLEARPAGATGNLLPYVQRAFETIAFARVSTSGPDATRLGYLRATDGFTMNRDRVIADAKKKALDRAEEGYRPPSRPLAIPVGGEGLLASLTLGVHLAWRAGRISDHDAVIARRLAWVLSGGSLPHATTVSEEYLLDLEREAFLSLCGERKTQGRIGYTLKSGKPLRN